MVEAREAERLLLAGRLMIRSPAFLLLRGPRGYLANPRLRLAFSEIE